MVREILRGLGVGYGVFRGGGVKRKTRGGVGKKCGRGRGRRAGRKDGGKGDMCGLGFGV